MIIDLLKFIFKSEKKVCEENNHTPSSIHNICKEYDITNYTINDDGTIDVNGSVNLCCRGLQKMPLKFRNVLGNFICSFNYLTSLEGSPDCVLGDFDCSVNKLVFLYGCPSKIGGSLICEKNKLKTLEYCPYEVGGSFNCSKNNIKSLIGCVKIIGSDFDCSKNEIKSLIGGPKIVKGGYLCSDNKLTSLFGINDIKSLIDCSNNQIVNFNGFPEYYDGFIFFNGNPISSLISRIPDSKRNKFIYWCNELHSILENGEVIQERMEEVYYYIDYTESKNEKNQYWSFST